MAAPGGPVCACCSTFRLLFGQRQGGHLPESKVYTLLQDLVPDQVRGRVFTLAIVTIQTMDMLAIALWGALAQGVSLRLLLAAAAALIAASCAVGWQRWSLPSNERSGIPDPEQA